MAIIDEKGRLFGKINVIDLLVIIGLVTVIAGAGYKFFLAPRAVKAQNAEVTVIIPAVRPEEAQSIQAGDQLVTDTTVTDARVKKVEIKPALTVTTRSDGTTLLTTNPYRKDAYVTLEGKVSLGPTAMKFAGQDIRVGKDFWLKSLRYELKGSVLSINTP